MRRAEQWILREIAGESILVPTGSAAVHFNGIVTVNDAGRVLYDALAEETDRAGLKARLMAEYEVDEATAEADVAEFLQQMREIGALVEEADGQK